jgi:hypothetical protein
MSDEDVIKTRPLRKEEDLLLERFYAAVAGQSSLMDKLAQTLLTVELAIPGLYATILKLVSGDKESLDLSHALYVAFSCWLIALAMTLFAVLPKRYKVNTDELRNTPKSIETFFYKSARDKWYLLMTSIAFFIVGIGSVLWDIFL